MMTPALMDDQLLADVAQAGRHADAFHLWWLGQSGYLLQWQGRHLLIDPYLSESLTEKYAGTDKPHVRMTRRPIDPNRLDFIDVVTSSHNHTDHLDRDTLVPLMQVCPEIVILVPDANREFAADRLGVDADRLRTIDAGTTVREAGFTFHGVPAAHEEVRRDAQGRCEFLGFIIEFGEWTVYHSGDTILYEGMVETLSKWHVDVAILPINGRAPERRVSGNLWGREAAKLAKQIGARLVIPCHYDMFEFNTVTPDEFVHTAIRLHQPYRVLTCGERWSSGQLAERS